MFGLSDAQAPKPSESCECEVHQVVSENGFLQLVRARLPAARASEPASMARSLSMGTSLGKIRRAPRISGSLIARLPVSSPA